MVAFIPCSYQYKYHPILLPLLLFCCIASSVLSAKFPVNPSSTTSISIPYVRKQTHDLPDQSLDFESFGFSLNGVDTDYMWLDRTSMSTSTKHEHEHENQHQQEHIIFSDDPDTCLQQLQPLQLHPASTVLNYGQALFEGLKAFRRTDGSIVVFRPTENAKRLSNGAKRLLLPEVPTDVFLQAVDSVVRSNARFIPPPNKGALYLRPLLFGSEKSLGVKPSKEVTFCIYASPVGNYFKGALRCIKLQAVRGYSRASRGGSGNIKASGNYAPPFLVQKEVKERGFDEALFLDCIRGQYIEEAGASNFFAVFTKTNTIVTPPLETKTILPGITRSSIIQLARSELGWNVEERNLNISELKDADEAFCCGTGASITPVGVVNYFSAGSDVAYEKDVPNGEDCPSLDDFEVTFGDGTCPGKVTEKLYQLLLGIQNGDLDDAEVIQKYSDWIHIVDP